MEHSSWTSKLRRVSATLLLLIIFGAVGAFLIISDLIHLEETGLKTRIWLGVTMGIAFALGFAPGRWSGTEDPLPIVAFTGALFAFISTGFHRSDDLPAHSVVVLVALHGSSTIIGSIIGLFARKQWTSIDWHKKAPTKWLWSFGVFMFYVGTFLILQSILGRWGVGFGSTAMLTAVIEVFFFLTLATVRESTDLGGFLGLMTAVVAALLFSVVCTAVFQNTYALIPDRYDFYIMFWPLLITFIVAGSFGSWLRSKQR